MLFTLNACFTNQQRCRTIFFNQGSCHLPCFEVCKHSSNSKAQVGDAKAQVHCLLLTIAPCWLHLFYASWQIQLVQVAFHSAIAITLSSLPHSAHIKLNFAFKPLNKSLLAESKIACNLGCKDIRCILIITA